MASAENTERARRAGLTRTLNAGFRHHQAGHLDRAAALYGKALAKEPAHAEALHLLGVIHYQQGKIGSAIELIERALPELRDLPEAHLNLGNALRKAVRLSEAVARYRCAIALDPGYGMAHSNLAQALNDQCCFEAALESSRRAIALIPDFVGAHLNCAAALLGLDRFAEAEAPLRRALELMPDIAEIHLSHAQVLRRLSRFDAAAASYRRALTLAPGPAWAHCDLGYILRMQGRHGEAIACFERALALAPDDPDALVGWFRERQILCCWPCYRENEAKVRDALASRGSLNALFALLGLSSTPADQFDCARRVAAEIAAHEPARYARRQASSGERVRLGYLSAEFNRHPVASLIAELIERHDRRRFEVVGYSLGPDDGSEMRTRLTNGFDRFVDLSRLPSRQAAATIHGDATNILVDLTGYTGNCRPAILACRPAPVQVNYLGYPGTMGADFIDYIIVDRFLVPPEQQRFYSERLVHLPSCYQPSDTKRKIAAPGTSRTECGLPEAGFVFCCFNNSYKITPSFFDIWMELLRAVPRSVLWLVARNELIERNLRREAARRGVAPERLVFMQPVAMPDYLARLGLADLFLDTLPHNAGATANDALWSGLPVLTCSGETYAGRMAGALLMAAGLPELVTTSLEDYAAFALRLATEPGILAALRQRLVRNRSTMPLFDIVQYTRDIEAAYARMWEIWREGQAPSAFSVFHDKLRL